MTLLQAIAHMEGFYELNSRPQRNNNPGDLSWGTEAQAFGATHGDPRFAVFPNAATGWVALQNWLSRPAKLVNHPVEGLFLDPNGTTLESGYLGATLAQVIHRFAPSSENNTQLYIDTVCKNTGLTPATRITSFLLETPEAS
jgi:hypothetical protein